MTSDIVTRKQTVVAQAAALIATRLENRESVAARAFLEALYEHAPPADIVARSVEDLASGALALWQFGARRAPGEMRVRVYNPGAARDGWSSPHTIVEIVNDDMPFLVDSVSAAINERGRPVRLVIHPVIAVSRDPAGNAVSVGAPDAARESWMQIEIARMRSAATRDALAEALVGVLGDVRAAAADRSPMREALTRLSDMVERGGGPVQPAEIDEGAAFLRWLGDGNFILLGMRDYDFAGGESEPPLGVLREAGYRAFGGLRDLDALPPAVRDFVRRHELLILSKTDRRSTVHRRVPMDAIGVRRFDALGEVGGLSLFVGLFTSAAYTGGVRGIPIVRRKVERVLARSGLPTTGHDGKALIHILDTFPRDELFQASEDWLYDTATGVLNLQERQRVALFVRCDPLERYVSCLVYAPRERYDTALRHRFAAILEEAFAGAVSTFYTHIDDSLLARVHFIIHRKDEAKETPLAAADVAALEGRLADAARSWLDRVEAAAEEVFGEAEAHRRLGRIAGFPADYQARAAPAQAVADLASIDKVLAGSPLEAALHLRDGDPTPGLRLYRRDAPVILSDVLPILENLGLRIVAEDAYRVDSADASAVWVHEFVLAPGAVATPLAEATRGNFQAALIAIFTGEIDNDGFNRLVLGCGLTARQTTILRLYCKVLRQAGSAFSQAYMEDTLAAHAGIARRLVSLFEARFSLTPPKGGALDIAAELRAIEEDLNAVESLDEDRILRGFLQLILKSMRTNYFQPQADGSPKPYLAVKLASSEIDLLPLPRPLFEIYVYSPRMEGVHMRAGKVARGGIRWSDRREDFRTEILGLMKAQTVKNAVIIPVGSKGGFVLKRPPLPGPNYRAELQAEGIACYKILMYGLLDLTDNIVADSPQTQHIEPPRDVVRHDPDDPYLVVAADKGTATFSDIANGIAIQYGFWLGDAFASGGSAGYDHKEIGITSRGAWELVKRHFRELDVDIQSADFTVIGVGDMGGDVFGNGMLQSRHIRLVGAFNHLHVFIDPNPDPAKSYAERERLFANPRLGWGDYDRGLISPGGGIFERSLKSIPVTPEMKRVFGIVADELTPAELIRHLLRAEVDLLFFGGIGTFVKARAETNGQVGDKANDALRIDGEDIRARVVGEGANLGVTERGRIAYAQKGGRIDTDAIDNSAGVSMSDHEVNIKILLGHAIATGALASSEREALLAAMTDDVAALVLRDNYLQGEALSVAAARGHSALDNQARMIRELEKSGRLDRALEFLPDEVEIAARAAAGRGLTRPELSVLLAYAKMSLDEALVGSDLPDAPELIEELCLYFPPALRERFAASIAAHPLRREIVATVVANDVVNRGGLTCVPDLAARTGRAPADIARAYRIVREAYQLPPLWAAIEALDNEVPAATQYEMLLDTAGIVEHAATWLLRAGRVGFAEIARFAPAVAHLSEAIGDLLPADERVLLDRRVARLAEAGVPPQTAAQIGAIVFLTTAFEIGDLAERSNQAIDRAASVFYSVGARFALDGLRDTARRLPAETQWQKTAVETLIDDFYALQADLAERVLKSSDGAEDPVAAWITAHAAALAPAEAVAAALRAAPAPDLAMLVVAGRQLRQALG